MRRIMAALLCLMILAAAGAAGAEVKQKLPDDKHLIVLPDSLKQIPVTRDDANLWKLFLGEDLELEIFLYRGNGLTLMENAQALTENGREAEIRLVGDTEMLCYRDRDEADGAPCIGYVYIDGNRFIELTFWYGSDEAGMMSYEIMESFQPLKKGAEGEEDTVQA